MAQKVKVKFSNVGKKNVVPTDARKLVDKVLETLVYNNTCQKVITGEQIAHIKKSLYDACELEYERGKRENGGLFSGADYAEA